MDQNFQTSFIPKKPIVNERVVSDRPVGFLLIISIIILFTVLLATGGLYVYKGVLTKQITSMQTDLSNVQNSFEPSKISELQVLDKRLRAANEVLNNHITITPIFNELEAVTLKNVRYTQFSYDAGTDNTANIDIKLSGQATSYAVIAQQSDLLSSDPTANKDFIDPVFSNLTLDNNGNVLFDLNFSVDRSFVNYARTVSVSPSN